MPTYMNALGCLLNLVGWQGSQINAHPKALAGTVEHCQFESDNSTGRTYDFVYDFSLLNSLEEAPHLK